MARGRYLMFIGDDDSIGPELRVIMSWIVANNVDATVSYTDSFLANYFWPGVVSKFFGGGYEINYSQVKHGGKNFIQTARVSFELEMSR